MSAALLKPSSPDEVETADPRERRREQMLDACTALIRREGPLVSMDQIAAASGVTKPIIYRHFGDRHGLVHALAVRLTEQLAACLVPVATRPEMAPRDLLTTTIDAYLAIVEQDTNLYEFVSENKPQDSKPHQLMALVAEQIANVVSAQLAAAGLSTTPARTWSYALVGMSHTVGQWWKEEHTMPRADLVELMVSLVWDGLGSLTPRSFPNSDSVARPKKKTA